MVRENMNVHEDRRHKIKAKKRQKYESKKAEVEQDE